MHTGRGLTGRCNRRSRRALNGAMRNLSVGNIRGVASVVVRSRVPAYTLSLLALRARAQPVALELPLPEVDCKYDRLGGSRVKTSIPATCLHSVQDLTGRGLLTVLDRPVLPSKTKTDMFDAMSGVAWPSLSRLTLRSVMADIPRRCQTVSAATRRFDYRVSIGCADPPPPIA